jgi:hypothetical protein
MAVSKSRPETVERLLHQTHHPPCIGLTGCCGVFHLPERNPDMPMKSNRDDTKNWRPERLDDGSVNPKGRDISGAIDRASNRTSINLSGGKTGKGGKKC